MLRPRMLALIILLLPLQPAAAAVYKWVDDQGNVHYTQIPPPERKAQALSLPPPPPEDGAGSGEMLKEEMEAFNERQQAREKRAQERRQAEDEAARRQALCEQARANLQTLTSRGQVRILEGETTRMLSEEERQAEIAKARRQIEEFCR